MTADFVAVCRLLQATTILCTYQDVCYCVSMTRPVCHVDDCTAPILLTQELQELVRVHQCQEG